MPGILGANTTPHRGETARRFRFYRHPAAAGGAAAFAKPRLKADRAELARFVDATFRCADDAGAAGLWTFVDRLADDLERHR
jgi:hypothetical protein